MGVKSIIRGVGGGVLGIVLMVVVFALPVLFFVGALWLGPKIMAWLILFSWIALAICILILLPLSIFRATRAVAGGLFLFISFVFAITVWFLGLLLTYYLWGIIAMIIGLVICGVGVVPIAMLATLLNGMWPELIALIVLVVLTFGCRIYGAVLCDS